MFSQDFYETAEKRFREEVLAPLEAQQAAKLAFVRQVYPQATKIVATVFFFIVGFVINKAIAPQKKELERRLERAAERLAPWGRRRKR